MFYTSVLTVGSRGTRELRLNVLHTIQLKHRHIAIVLCQKCRNIAFILGKDYNENAAMVYNFREVHIVPLFPVAGSAGSQPHDVE